MCDHFARKSNCQNRMRLTNSYLFAQNTGKNDWNWAMKFYKNYCSTNQMQRKTCWWDENIRDLSIFHCPTSTYLLAFVIVNNGKPESWCSSIWQIRKKQWHASTFKCNEKLWNSLVCIFWRIICNKSCWFGWNHFWNPTWRITQSSSISVRKLKWESKFSIASNSYSGVNESDNCNSDGFDTFIQG